MIAALVLPVAAFSQSQDAYKAFCSKLSASMTSFSYTYKVDGKIPLSGSGNVVLQGDSFSLKGDGIEVFCDSKTRWTVDRAAKEAYAEPADADFAANPALLVGNLDRHFKLSSTSPLTLVPVDSKIGLRSVVLVFDGQTLKQLRLTSSDGNMTTIVISALKHAPLSKDLSEFSFDPKTLGKEYVITDLR